MKILSAQQIREADAYTIAQEPVKSIDLMERAAEKCVEQITVEKGQAVRVFCGMGNNGGDGLAIARMLKEKKYKVEVYIVHHTDKGSSDFKANERKLKRMTIRVHELKGENPAIAFQPGDLLIDAIFGSGLNRAPEGLAANVIAQMNSSGCKVIAIDIPSGLFADEPSLHTKQIVKAWRTLTFQVPKLAFLFPGNAEYVGDIAVLDIGLHQGYIAALPTNNYFVTHADAKALLRPRKKFSHKGSHGHALIVAGSYGKMGAAALAAKACLRAGAGLVTAHVPSCGNVIIQSTVPEALCSTDSNEHFIGDNIKLEAYSAVGIGPGLGTQQQTQNILKLLIQNAGTPLVLDADALNILAENKTWLSFIPAGSILTPHPKEFGRLAGNTTSDFDRHKLQKEFSVKHGVYVVLKGAHSAISTPDGKFWFNSSGNPGMAKGGSGDALTGILTALIAQGYSSLDACVLGVYLHGLAADMAALETGEHAMLARDIIDSLPQAFKFLGS